MSDRDVPESVPAAAARGWHPALKGFVLFYAVSGAVDAYARQQAALEPMLLALQVAIGGFLIFWWASDDAARRGQRLGRATPLWIVLFGMFWIVLRLLRTRERAEAYRGLARGAWVALAAFAAYLATFTLFAPATPL